MIIELYGLPCSGKTTLAKEIVKKTDFKIVKIRNKKELFYFNLLFLIKHPIKFFKLLFFVISNSISKPKLFYYKLMNCFFDYNAKCQKALRYKNAILDQGYFQNIVSLFEKPITFTTLRKYKSSLPFVSDQLIIVDTFSDKIEKRIKRRGISRDKFGKKYVKKWLKIIKVNHHFFKNNIDNLNINSLVISTGQDKENLIREFLNSAKTMKIVYLTAIQYPSPTASAHQIKSMSRAFQKILADNFLLIVNRISKKILKNLNFHEVNYPFSKFRTFYYLYLFLINKFSFLDKNTIIYTKDPQLLCIANLFKKKYGYKTCFELHVPWRSKIKFIIWGTDFFVVLNNYLRDFLTKKYKVEEKRILVSPDAVEVEVFDIKKTKEECRKILNLPYGKKLIGYIGRFKTEGKEKGVRVILEIASFFDDDVLFYFVGGMPKEIEEYKNIAKRKGILKRCVFVPFQPFEKLPLYMKAMDLFLMPFPKAEHYEYHMSPLKMFEYMASKRPLIATNLPSLTSILNEQNSLLVRPDNKEELINAVKKLLNDESFGKKIAERAFIDVQQYTWDKRAKQIINFLNKLR